MATAVTANKRTTFDVLWFIRDEIKKLSKDLIYDRSGLSFWIQPDYYLGNTQHTQPGLFQFSIVLKTKGARATSPSLKGALCELIVPESKIEAYTPLFKKIEKQIPILVETIRKGIKEVAGYPTEIRLIQERLIYKLLVKVCVEGSALDRHSLKVNGFLSNTGRYELEVSFNKDKQAAIDCMVNLTEPYFKFD
nr:MAG TPA: hypothetical protein [Caudoviricetes sp.]